jgi:hypothetical protein
MNVQEFNSLTKFAADTLGVVLYDEWHSKTADGKREHRELVLTLCDYLNDNHASYFARPVTPQTLKRWVERGLCELNETSLEIAIYEKRIPPRRGRPKVPEVEDENADL